MKKAMLLMMIILGCGFIQAQETPSFTEEELEKYATVMVWAEIEKGSMTETYNNWINNDESIEAARFVKLKAAKGDEVKLQELEATTEERAAFNQIQSSYDSMTSAFKEVYVGKIKTDIGAGLYNQLRKAMKSDAEVKAKYQDIYDGLLEVQSTEPKEEELED